MPNKDGKGPEGQGSRTGRGLGNCAPANGDTNQTPARGQGLGRGAGTGRGRNQGSGLGRGRNA